MTTIPTIILYIFPLIFILLIVLIMFWQEKRFERLLADKENPSQLFSTWLREISDDISHTSDRINRQLHTNNESINNRLDNTAQLLRLLNHDLGKVHEIGQQMRDFQQLFRTPKLRGVLGEQLLTDLLYQILPKTNVKLQYRFQSGDTVDAVVLLQKGMIPIDAKFPMENYLKAEKTTDEQQKSVYRKEFNRDVKRHIDTIAKKYIKPGEGTLDFAILYIPSESIYYQLAVNEELLKYAQDKKIMPSSPNQFYYFLRIILMGLEGQKIEETAQKVLQSIYTLENQVNTMRTDLSTLSTHINNAKNSSDKLFLKFENLSNRLQELRFIKD